MGSLDGKVAVVTGASKGIGRAIASALSEAGAAVALGSRGRRALDRTAREITTAGGRAIARATDVRESAQCDALVAAAIAELGGLDILVNNAGVGSFGPIAQTSDEEWQTVLETNLSGAFYCTRAALRHFLPRRAGHVVNICSVAGREAIPGASAYCASKFGLAAFADVLSREVASAGVRVTTLYPGRVTTNFSRGGDDELSDASEAERPNSMTARDVAHAVLAAVASPRTVVHDTIVLYPAPEYWDD